MNMRRQWDTSAHTGGGTADASATQEWMLWTQLPVQERMGTRSEPSLAQKLLCPAWGLRLCCQPGIAPRTWITQERTLTHGARDRPSSRSGGVGETRHSVEGGTVGGGMRGEDWTWGRAAAGLSCACRAESEASQPRTICVKYQPSD